MLFFMYVSICNTFSLSNLRTSTMTLNEPSDLVPEHHGMHVLEAVKEH